MDIAGLIVGGFVGTVLGLMLGGMLSGGKVADAEYMASCHKEIADRLKDEIRAMHGAEQLHSDEVKRIGKMGKRRGAITGANA
jgi:hypothetical protein